MPRIVGFLPALVLATALGCSGGGSSAGGTSPIAPPADPANPAVADVNGLPIGSKAIDDAAHRKEAANGSNYTPEEKKALLDQAVDDELLFQEAFRRGIYNDPKVKKIMTSLMLRQDVYEKVTNEQFTDEQIQAAFEASKDDYIVPEKVLLRVIYVEINDTRDSAAAKKRADEAFAKAKANPDGFRELAEEYSDGEYAKRGGEVGYIGHDGKAGIPPEIIDAAFALEQNGVAEPVQIGNGWWVVNVPTKREKVERTLEQVRGAVLRRLKTEQYEKLTQDILKGLRESAKINVDQAALDKWEPTAPTAPPIIAPGGRMPVPGSIPGNITPEPAEGAAAPEGAPAGGN